MKKMYLSAPLPFVGQKRMFAKEFIKVLGQFPDSTVFVDLFGGSGLLSHITKCVRPDAVVVYNDFDNYRQRLANIPATNVLLSDLRRIAEGEPRNKRITGEVRDKMFARIEREEKEHGYVDYITISASLLFAMKYVTCLKEIKKRPYTIGFGGLIIPKRKIIWKELPSPAKTTRKCSNVTRMSRVWCSWLIRRTFPLK